MIDSQTRNLRDIGSQFGAELRYVVVEKRGLVAGAGDGYVGETPIDQIGMDTGIGVDENAVGGKSLGCVTGDRVTVVEMTMVASVKSNLAVLLR